MQTSVQHWCLNVTESVISQVIEWRNRPLDDIYPIVYLDGIIIKVRQDKQIIKKTLYIALGVNLDGRKECLGLWLSENESSTFWLGVLMILPIVVLRTFSLPQ